MPSNHNLAFHKRCNEPDLRRAQKADITLLAGLRQVDEHTAAIIAAGNLRRAATSDRSACLWTCTSDCFWEGTQRLKIVGRNQLNQQGVGLLSDWSACGEEP